MDDISCSGIGVIKSRRMMWARHFSRKGEMRSAYKMLIGREEWGGGGWMNMGGYG
jgi:hypothetical protein